MLSSSSGSAIVMPSRHLREDPVDYSFSVCPRNLERQVRVFYSTQHKRSVKCSVMDD
jgi:hypothetical protein